MDGNRLDSIARSIATWSSRRKLIGRAAGAALGAAALSTHTAAAQTPDFTDSCGPDADSSMNGTIRDSSDTLLTKLQGLNIPKSTYPDGLQMSQLVDQLKCFFAHGKTAVSTEWNGGQTRLFLSQAQSIISALSIGFSAARFADKTNGPATPEGIHGLLPLNEAGVCGSASCTANALNRVFTCLHGCNNGDKCSWDCFTTFVEEYLVGTESHPGCATDLAAYCQGDCCLSNCICGHC